MKKALKDLLSEFKWYRKRKGGKWFLVYEKEGYNTLDEASTHWTQAPNDTAEIIKEENHSLDILPGHTAGHTWQKME